MLALAVGFFGGQTGVWLLSSHHPSPAPRCFLSHIHDLDPSSLTQILLNTHARGAQDPRLPGNG